MKRLVVICLAVMMLCTNAFAATWADGLGPQKPYLGTPEVDFNETIGYMMLYPTNGDNVNVDDLLVLKIYLPREDVAVGEGKLAIKSKGIGVIEEIEITEETFVARPMTEEELEALMWGCGTVFEIALEKPLQINRNYYVEMSEGAIVSNEYEAVSPKISGKKEWYFNTETENYIDKLSYKRVVEGKDKPQSVDTVQVGDYAEFDIVMAEDTAYAVIFCDNGAIIPASNYFEEGVKTTIDFPVEGTVEWGVAFFDAEDYLLYIHRIETVVNAAE